MCADVSDYSLGSLHEREKAVDFLRAMVFARRAKKGVGH